MELIQPAEISGKIMTLIDQAKDHLIIVSPYNNIRTWEKLKRRIQIALDRGVKITWYLRDNVKDNMEQVSQLGVETIAVKNLHCKMYLNEKNGVVTSMNLTESSDKASIDIGYWVSNSEKHKELQNFIEIHLKPLPKSIKSPHPSIVKHVEIKENAGNEFINLIQSLLLQYSGNYYSMTNKSNRYGNMVILEGFCQSFDLILEPRKYYYRIDLRVIGSKYKSVNLIYQELMSVSSDLINKCANNIEFGGTMKRLKIDLDIFGNYNYSAWSKNEFDLLKPKLIRIIEVFVVELKRFA